MKSLNPLLTPTNSLEHQWSEFIENEHNSLLESSSGTNFLFKEFVKEFSSFRDLYSFLIENPNLLKLKDLGILLLKSYEGKEYIKLYKEIQELKELKLEASSNNLNAEILLPSKLAYIKAVEKCQAHIKEGDIYQANLCHEFAVKLKQNYSKAKIKDIVYKKLRKLNPSEYMALAEFSKHIIFSSSPESLLQIEFKAGNFQLSSSPIKGTAYLGDDLETLMNEKEKAEHIMIVDLIRNDLGKISQTASVKVEKLLEDKQYENLQHLVSKIRSELKEELTLDIAGIKLPDFDLVFNAMFPGGSITGAPKIRSIEIIKELETNNRELFTGTLGFYKFHQQKGEFNILIRSVFFNKETNKLSFSTGAGITSNSNPEKEYEETLLKAQKLIEVFE